MRQHAIFEIPSYTLPQSVDDVINEGLKTAKEIDVVVFDLTDRLGRGLAAAVGYIGNLEQTPVDYSSPHSATRPVHVEGI